MQSSDKLENSIEPCSFSSPVQLEQKFEFYENVKKKYTDMSEILAIILDNENENENESCSGTYFDSSCDESDDTMDWEEVIESDEETDLKK